ncbi:hypothetical protein [Actinocatenispora sera]|uniref:Uncharacterized protein n=1 Tax=Actinocatenispora sera TaxID=390989 RepID=A0A810KXR6_9ACTN|nr:hypothetical protein [Actinocatenispora sera]BCJ27884.1 hypothetical protein Asera_19920 [Actinocatenispora sera]
MNRTLLAARNNADWCRAMCRAHGLLSHDSDAVWSCAERTPPYYPDAVTLRPQVTADEVLAGIDVGPGCSVKDSFGTLDLSSAGFVPIIEATWLYREVGADADGLDEPAQRPADEAMRRTVDEPARRRVDEPAQRPADEPRRRLGHGSGWRPTDEAGWRRIDDGEALTAWVAAWGGGAGIFRPELLTDPDVALLARYDGDTVTGGAVANRSAGSIGISNLYASTGDPASVWRGAVATAYEIFEPLPVVGYEHGDDLAAAVRAGCTPLTDLRIWLNPAPPR